MKLQAGEQAIKGDSASYVKGKLSVWPGVLTLTNQRLVFDQRNAIASAFGLLGALVLGPILPRRVVVDLPLGQIASFSRGQYGRNQNVVAINSRDGKNYRFLAGFDAWAPVLAQAGIAQEQPASAE